MQALHLHRDNSLAHCRRRQQWGTEGGHNLPSKLLSALESVVAVQQHLPVVFAQAADPVVQ